MRVTNADKLATPNLSIDRPISIAPLRAGGLPLKIPGRLEVAVREKLSQLSNARYECAGGWEVMYQRNPQDSGHFGPELKY